MNEIKDAQEQINMRIYSSESIKKIQSFFTLEIDHLLSISEICVMGILSFLIKNDYMDKKKEEEYINITYNFKYDKIKNKIISNPEITITDFIHCYRDYIIINALGRDKEHIFSSIEKFLDAVRMPKLFPARYTASAPKRNAVSKLSLSPAGDNISGLFIIVFFVIAIVSVIIVVIIVSVVILVVI